MSRVARSYVDALGTERRASEETVARFEALLGPDDRPFIAPSIVVREYEPVIVETTLPAMSWTESLQWAIDAHDVHEGRAELRDAPVVATERRDDVTWDVRRVTLLPSLPAGTYRARLRVDSYAEGATTIVVVPQRAVAPLGRTWGFSLQLYTLRSARNHGIGDFADLQAVCTLAGARGARYVGINPLHAGFRSDPEAASPYAGASRRWLNPWYIALDLVPEIAAGAADEVLREHAPALEYARAADLVDYTAVATVKDAALRAGFTALNGARAQAFDAWCTAQGDPLTRFAAFEAIVARFGRDVAGWPATLHEPTSPDVALFAAGAHDEVRFAMYLQWVAAEQLQAVARDAGRRGVLLYRDLAVGVDAQAADVWSDRDAYVPGVSVGAPPDELNTLGQDWGLPPMNPAGLPREGYAELLALLEANCRDAGALRIDHAMSLARLYWIPAGSGAREGTYVAYPFDDVRGMVALASARTGCVIIGEDLGTVPSGFREAMTATGILSYRILFFERRDDGSYRAPEEYPALALATSGTHDLPTIAAWLDGDDLVLRERLGLLETPLDDARRARAAERDRFLDALVAHGDLRADERDDLTAIVIAANRYLAAAPCAIVMAQLDDILGERTPVNVPGTSDQYPNWRRKLTVPVEALATDDRFARLCTALSDIRPRPTP